MVSMAIKKLILDDFSEAEHFSLIAIHCTIEDYRLAFLLNKNLEISLTRQKQDIDNYKLNTYYSIFEWEDNTKFKTWNLVSNNCSVSYNEVNENVDSLFNLNETLTKTFYLLPKYKKANFLLKINSELGTNKEKFILEKILTIDQVITAYSIDVNKLKSKNQLIFN